MSIAALILAAGSGSRAGGVLPKQYQDLGGRSVLRHVLEAFAAHPRLERIKVVISGSDGERYAAAAKGLDLDPPVLGGATRQESGRLGLEAMGQKPPRQVLIHDAARPFVSADLIDRVIDALESHEGAVPALPVTDTLKRAPDGIIAQTIGRDGLWTAQTPQGFWYDLIHAAHERAAASNLTHFTDDASIGEWAGMKIAVVPGDSQNLKLTTANDLRLAEERYADDVYRRCPDVRVGQGLDVHAFEPGDHVTLCGVRIPHDRALKGHSDADAALHALTDALLGSIGEADIGTHFPPSDMRWRKAESSLFLRHAAGLIENRGGFIAHVDLTIVCEAPKIAPHVPAMRKNLAALLRIAGDRIAIKATTSEGLGFTGRSEGLMAWATATVRLP
jgi:2-C-methyl-D-erythritol 4-phosphate cytidylyltransferase / 2-C-methyl-D-erythritol 2,4-cyclodiphosphate synthase